MTPQIWDPLTQKQEILTSPNFFSDPLWGLPYWPQKDKPLGSSRHVANRIAYNVTFTIIGLWHLNFETP